MRGEGRHAGVQLRLCHVAHHPLHARPLCTPSTALPPYIDRALANDPAMWRLCGGGNKQRGMADR